MSKTCLHCYRKQKLKPLTCTAGFHSTFLLNTCITFFRFSDFRNDVKTAALTPRLILFTEKPTSENRRNVYQQVDPFCNFPTIGVWNLPPPFTTPTLTLSTPLSLKSNLPSPPNKSPEFQVSEETFEPIEPPKKRRFSIDELKKSMMEVTKRPASTSSAWTPWIR